MKYVILKSVLAGQEQKIPIIFPNFLVHSDVAKYIAGNLIRQHGRPVDITVSSAGFINLGDVACHGESETCKVKSDPLDADVIQMHDYLFGIEGDPQVEQVLRKLLKERK